MNGSMVPRPKRSTPVPVDRRAGWELKKVDYRVVATVPGGPDVGQLVTEWERHPPNREDTP